MRRLTARDGDSKRHDCAAIRVRPAAFAASNISRASATDVAIGFSHSTLAPAASANSTGSRWATFGSSTCTESGFSRSIISL